MATESSDEEIYGSGDEEDDEDDDNNVNRSYYRRDLYSFDATLPPTIQIVEAHTVLDGCGFSTVEVSVTLHNRIWATTRLPCGAPVGIYDYITHATVYRNYVDKDVRYVNDVLAPALIGKDPLKQAEIDNLMAEIQHRDGTAKDRNRRRLKLGINAIMAVSVAVCKVGAYLKNVPLARHVADLAGTSKLVIPVPSAKLLNGGGSDSDNNNIPFQEISITPLGYDFNNAQHINIYAYGRTEQAVVKKDGRGSFVFATNGNVVLTYDGFSTSIRDVKEGVDFLKNIVVPDSNLSGKAVFGLNFAVSDFYDSTSTMYNLDVKDVKNDGSGKVSGAALKDFYLNLMNEYDSMICSISNPFHQDDWDNYSNLTAEIGAKARVVMEDSHLLDDGSDFERMKKAVLEKICNALLLKVHHRASLTECIEIVKLCKEAGWAIVMATKQYLGAPRDAFIVDLSVGLAVDEIRMGLPLEFQTQFWEVCAEFLTKAVYAGAT